MTRKISAPTLRVMATSVLLALSANARQVAGKSFKPPVPDPAYRPGNKAS
ncbi:MAG TPA: hypothetical protein VGB98_14710 [Pyrinomonadaceae bacterium]|jgi:hypothetical protein